MAESRFTRRAFTPAGWVTVGAWLVCVAAFFLYAVLRIDTRLVYYEQIPIFLTTSEAFTDALAQPGGLLDYASRFLAQLFWWRWTGAAVLSAVAVLLCLATSRSLSLLSGRRVHPAIALAPAALLLLVHQHYGYPLLHSLGILVGVCGFLVFASLSGKTFVRRLSAFVVVSLAFYYVAAGAALLVAALCGLFCLLRKRWWVLGAVCLALAVALPTWHREVVIQLEASKLHWPVSPALAEYAETYPESWPATLGLEVKTWVNLTVEQVRDFASLPAFPVQMFEKTPALAWSQLTLLCYVPAMGLVLATVGLLAGVLPLVKRWLQRPPVRLERLVTFTVLVAGAAALLWWTFPEGVKRRLEVGYHTRHGEWEKALDAALRVPPKEYDWLVLQDVNRSLYHTGRLGEDLFKYIQYAPSPTSPVSVLRQAELDYDLGRMNPAQHMGSQAFEEKPDPALLAMLAKANVLRDRPRIARVFLGALRKHLLWRRWADAFTARLDAEEDRLRRDPTSGPLMKDDPELGPKRAFLLKKDYPYGGLLPPNATGPCQQCLQSNPTNRMAFEYLIMQRLLMRNRDARGHIVTGARIGRALWVYRQAVSSVELPTLYEEAIVLHQHDAGTGPLSLGRHKIRPQTRTRLGNFLSDWQRYAATSGIARKEAYRTLVEKWGSTYFFYHKFGYSEPRGGWRVNPETPAEGATP